MNKGKGVLKAEPVEEMILCDVGKAAKSVDKL